MRTFQGFPAPDRDMANVEPQVPPADSEVGPVTNSLVMMLTIGLGIATCIWGMLGLVLQGDVTPNSGAAMIGAGICFIVGGLLMRTGSLMLPLIAVVAGILLGIASRTMF